MTIHDKQLHLCTCNGTIALDAEALASALRLESAPPIARAMCQRGIGDYAGRAAGELVVGCTQESRVLAEAAEHGGRVQTIRFVNIRENAGWSAESRVATPKIAALLASAALPDPDPVPAVSYRSDGRVLVIGAGAQAIAAAEALSGQMTVAVLLGDARGVELPLERRYEVFSGRVERIDGWLGAFTIRWIQDNPIDLEACTRCNACVRACPEDAIDFSYQIDLDRCRAHRDCVAACKSVGAIDFDRADRVREERFDLVLDLSAQPLIRLHQPPQGYFAPALSADHGALALEYILVEVVRAVGEFEKPRYFAYKPSICAHSRSQKQGCNRCIEVCSTAAITSDGDHIRVEPHLCMGCGGCATVCPSGALSYAYPTVPELGLRLKTLLRTYRDAGGRDACLLFHNSRAGRRAIAELARRGRGLPARVIPVEVHHVASVGLDLWLAAFAYGASEVATLLTPDDARSYVEAVAEQMNYANVITEALGYQGRHFHDWSVTDSDFQALEQAVWALRPTLGPRVPASFNATADKRTTIELALEHLVLHAPTPVTVVPLAKGAPFGSITVNAQTCTLCLACVGACPEGAILDNTEAPQLRFIERKCVQCGLCATTCPERAIALDSRLLLGPEAKQPRVVHEAAVVGCIRCSKPLGTEKMIGNMLAKLAGHSMFADPGALERLRMCADCRVIDLMQNEKSLSYLPEQRP